MAMLMQFDPFREFDRLAEQAMSGARTPRAFPMDAYRRGDEFVVSFDLPGMDPGKIDLTVEQNVLMIKAERRFEDEAGDEWTAAERPYGTFTRQLFLGETLDVERLEASYEAGVLKLRIPVAESAKPRKVQITGATDKLVIEAQTAPASP
jgi:HSP20 family protein